MTQSFFIVSTGPFAPNDVMVATYNGIVVGLATWEGPYSTLAVMMNDGESRTAAYPEAGANIRFVQWNSTMTTSNLLHSTDPITLTTNSVNVIALKR